MKEVGVFSLVHQEKMFAIETLKIQQYKDKKKNKNNSYYDTTKK